MRNPWLKSAALACLVVILAPCGLHAEQIVTLSGASFTPSDLTIGAGETVKWVWNSGFHSTTSVATTGPEVWNSGNVSAPFSFSHTFTTVGDYAYICQVHEAMGMTGIIRVVAGPTVASVAPRHGPPAGGVAITITGTLFQTGAGVLLGATSASGVTVTPPTTIDAITPSLPAGAVHPLTVVNSDGGRDTVTQGFLTHFADVPVGSPFHDFVNTVAWNGVTLGCGGGNYCPSGSVTRKSMAAFLARAIAGSDDNVPAAGMVGTSSYNCAPTGGTSLFSDIPATDSFCRHVHYIAAQDVTLGCEPGVYCPSDLVRRSQMAMFVARAIAGDDASVPENYTDPVTARSYDCGTVAPALQFTDISPSQIFCRHVHYLWATSVVDGCTGTSYCPQPFITRVQMAKFLALGFDMGAP